MICPPFAVAALGFLWPFLKSAGPPRPVCTAGWSNKDGPKRRQNQKALRLALLDGLLSRLWLKTHRHRGTAAPQPALYTEVGKSPSCQNSIQSNCNQKNNPPQPSKRSAHSEASGDDSVCSKLFIFAFQLSWDTNTYLYMTHTRWRHADFVPFRLIVWKRMNFLPMSSWARCVRVVCCWVRGLTSPSTEPVAAGLGRCIKRIQRGEKLFFLARPKLKQESTD